MFSFSGRRGWQWEAANLAPPPGGNEDTLSSSSSSSTNGDDSDSDSYISIGSSRIKNNRDSGKKSIIQDFHEDSNKNYIEIDSSNKEEPKRRQNHLEDTIFVSNTTNDGNSSNEDEEYNLNDDDRSSSFCNNEKNRNNISDVGNIENNDNAIDDSSKISTATPLVVSRKRKDENQRMHVDGSHKIHDNKTKKNKKKRLRTNKPSNDETASKERRNNRRIARRNEKNSVCCGGETSEASLARLTYSYKTALSCIGSLHRLNQIDFTSSDHHQSSAESEPAASVISPPFATKLISNIKSAVCSEDSDVVKNPTSTSLYTPSVACSGTDISLDTAKLNLQINIANTSITSTTITTTETNMKDINNNRDATINDSSINSSIISPGQQTKCKEMKQRLIRLAKHTLEGILLDPLIAIHAPNAVQQLLSNATAAASAPSSALSSNNPTNMSPLFVTAKVVVVPLPTTSVDRKNNNSNDIMTDTTTIAAFGEALSQKIQNMTMMMQVSSSSTATSTAVHNNHNIMVSDNDRRNGMINGRNGGAASGRGGSSISNSRQQRDRNALREVAYLTLVNYSDLLLSSGHNIDNIQTVGTTDTAKKKETEITSLVCLCDAVDIDPTDPTVYIQIIRLSKKLRKEKLYLMALQRGLTCLPEPNMVPNRWIKREWDECCSHLQKNGNVSASSFDVNMDVEMDIVNNSKSSSKSQSIAEEEPKQQQQQQQTLDIDLPRYEWSALGRSLMRACRTSTTVTLTTTSATTAKQPVPVASFALMNQSLCQQHQHQLPFFGSPTIYLRVSFLLSLSPTALGTVCDYLIHTERQKLESTCRAVSTCIISARVALEQQERAAATTSTTASSSSATATATTTHYSTTAIDAAAVRTGINDSDINTSSPSVGTGSDDTTTVVTSTGLDTTTATASAKILNDNNTNDTAVLISRPAATNAIVVGDNDINNCNKNVMKTKKGRNNEDCKDIISRIVPLQKGVTSVGDNQRSNLSKEEEEVEEQQILQREKQVNNENISNSNAAHNTTGNMQEKQLDDQEAENIIDAITKTDSYNHTNKQQRITDEGESAPQRDINCTADESTKKQQEEDDETRQPLPFDNKDNNKNNCIGVISTTDDNKNTHGKTHAKYQEKVIVLTRQSLDNVTNIVKRARLRETQLAATTAKATTTATATSTATSTATQIDGILNTKNIYSPICEEREQDAAVDTKVAVATTADISSASAKKCTSVQSNDENGASLIASSGTAATVAGFAPASTALASPAMVAITAITTISSKTPTDTSAALAAEIKAKQPTQSSPSKNDSVIQKKMLLPTTILTIPSSSKSTLSVAIAESGAVSMDLDTGTSHANASKQDEGNDKQQRKKGATIEIKSQTTTTVEEELSIATPMNNITSIPPPQDTPDLSLTTTVATTSVSSPKNISSAIGVQTTILKEKLKLSPLPTQPLPPSQQFKRQHQLTLQKIHAQAASVVGDRSSRGRTSSRVRSQQLSIDKEATKTARRTSVEYCLLSSVLSITNNNTTDSNSTGIDGGGDGYNSCVASASSLSLATTEVNWNDLPPVRNLTCLQYISIIRKSSSNNNNINCTIYKNIKETDNTHKSNDTMSFSCSRKQMHESQLRPSASDFPRATKTPAHIKQQLLYHKIDMDVTARTAPSSLRCFMDEYSGNNSGPMHMLYLFLKHVAHNVDYVFWSESSNASGGGAMVLSSCILECSDMLLKRSGKLSRSLFSPSWIGPTFAYRNRNSSALLNDDKLLLSMEATSSFSLSKIVEIFAINLLIAELKLRRCERSGIDTDDYDSDVNAVSFMVPHLLESLSHIQEQIGMQQQQQDLQASLSLSLVLAKLETRCYWLGSMFYLWVGRHSKTKSDSNHSEQIGMECLDQTLSCLEKHYHSKVNVVVRTPHLESPSRIGPHWKELSITNLRLFRDDMQAASVVTNARLRFQDLQKHILSGCKSSNDNGDGRIADTDATAAVAADVCDTASITISSPSSLYPPPVKEDDDNSFTNEAKKQHQEEHQQQQDSHAHTLGVLAAIANDLQLRYCVEYEGNEGKHEELLNDFLNYHTGALSSSQTFGVGRNGGDGNEEGKCENHFNRGASDQQSYCDFYSSFLCTPSSNNHFQSDKIDAFLDLTSENAKESFVAKWGNILWESIPSSNNHDHNIQSITSSCSTTLTSGIHNTSILTIFAICCLQERATTTAAIPLNVPDATIDTGQGSGKGKNPQRSHGNLKLSLVKLLTRLVLTAFDQYAKILLQTAEAKLNRGYSAGSHQIIGSDNEDDYDMISDNDDGNNNLDKNNSINNSESDNSSSRGDNGGHEGGDSGENRRKRTGRLRKDKILLLAIEFFLDKIVHLVATISTTTEGKKINDDNNDCNTIYKMNPTAALFLEQYISSKDVLSVVQVASLIAAARLPNHTKSEYDTTTQKSALSFITSNGGDIRTSTRSWLRSSGSDHHHSLTRLPNVNIVYIISFFVRSLYTYGYTTVREQQHAKQQISDNSKQQTPRPPFSLPTLSHCCNHLESAYFCILSNTLIEERKQFPILLRAKGDRSSRFLRQKVCIARANFIAVVSSELTRLFTRNLFSIHDGAMKPSCLIQSATMSSISSLPSRWSVTGIGDCSPSMISATTTNMGLDIDTKNSRNVSDDSQHYQENNLTNGQLHQQSDTTNINNSNDNNNPRSLDLAPLIKLSESLLWFWKYTNNISTSNSDSSIVTSTDRAVSKRLLVPIAAATVAFCGSVGNATIHFHRNNLGVEKEEVCAAVEKGEATRQRRKKRDVVFQGSVTSPQANSSSMFESDSSVNCFVCDDDDYEKDNNSWVNDGATNKSKHSSNNCVDERKIKRFRAKHLQLLCELVHVVGLIYGNISEKRACEYLYVKNGPPLLPFVIVRTLTHLSDIILTEFGEPNVSSSIDINNSRSKNKCNSINSTTPSSSGSLCWSEKYPYGARKTGAILDLLLCKAYCCLHGIVLVPTMKNNKEKSNSQAQSSMLSSIIAPSVAPDHIKFRFHPPENTIAAARLYRCIKRVYSKGRKTPPRAALETVAAALLPLEQTRWCEETRKAICDFLYNPSPIFSNVGKDSKPSLSASPGQKKQPPTLSAPVSQGLPPRFPLEILEQEVECDGQQQQQNEYSTGNKESVWSTSSRERKHEPINEQLHGYNTGSTILCYNEELILRKNLCRDLANGPLPLLVSNKIFVSTTEDYNQNQSNILHSPAMTTSSKKDSMDRGKYDDEHSCVSERANTAQQEIDLVNKFSSILDDLCFSPRNHEGWFAAGQCINAKAGLICDRIGNLRCSYNQEEFFARAPSATSRPRSLSGTRKSKLNNNVGDFDKLLFSLLKKKEQLDRESIRTIGNDLSCFLRYPWSSLSRLKDCATEIGSSFGNNDCTEQKEKTGQNDELIGDSMHSEDEHILPTLISPPQCSNNDSVMNEAKAWKSIQCSAVDEDYSSWQNSWGSLFVSVLRNMADKCHQVSYFLAKQHATRMMNSTSKSDAHDAAILMSEICETMATSKYGELQGSVKFGFPLSKMSDGDKYCLADHSMQRFQESIEWLDKSGDAEMETWPLQFMVGKCYEKMAVALNDEAYKSELPGESNIRQYESLLCKAFTNYKRALEGARIVNKERGIDVREGGSSHGISEIEYRIHATRLKVILRSIQTNTKQNEKAAFEALRLTEKHWFAKQPQTTICVENTGVNIESSFKSVKERRWEVFRDVIAAMLKLRANHAFFHRSVYRHAQAILWVPFLREEEVSQDILRELSGLSATATTTTVTRLSTESAAAEIMGNLFEKKRINQLCAVWVTSAFSCPFESLNGSVRKYDRLRMKYTGAYLDTLRFTRRLNDLEMFQGRLASCMRDLPNFYYASAKVGGRRPPKHIKDNLLDSTGLLCFAKRRANMAVADIIIQKLCRAPAQKMSVASGIDFGSAYKPVSLSDFLGRAFACFLRLRCSADDVRKKSVKLGSIDVLEVDCFLVAWTIYCRQKGVTAFPFQNEFEARAFSMWAQRIMCLRKAVEVCQNIYPDIASTFSRKKRKRKRIDKIENEGIDTRDITTTGYLDETNKTIEIDDKTMLSEKLKAELE